MDMKNFTPCSAKRATILMFGMLLGLSTWLSGSSAFADNKPKPAAKPATPAKPAVTPAKPAGAPAKPGSAPGPTKPATGSGTPTKPTTSNPNPKPTTANPKPATGNPNGKPGTGGSTARSTGPAMPKGSQKIVAKNGAEVTKRANGKIADIHDTKRGMDIHHGLDGSRRVSVERRDGSRLVAERGRPGYVQRGYNYHGHDFAHRSYYYNGRHYDRYYRGYGYRGVYLNVYAPAYYYSPGFYGWAYNPWAVPVAYGWGWGGSPWLGFYGGYFTPFAVYPSSAFWLTDYILSQDLQAAYAARAGGVQAGIAVSPTEPWTDTGTQAVQGQTYNITAAGMLQFNSDAASLAPPVGRADRGPGIDPPCWVGRSHPNFPAPQAPCLSLIGKIGPNGIPFFVGNSLTLVAPASGELFLGVNDQNLSDNAGGWVATVTQPGGSDTGATQQASAGATPLTPEVKQLIADEVKNQLALENAEAAQTAQKVDVDAASSGIARLLGDGKPHMFVAGGGLDVTDTAGNECHISDGDALQLVEPPPATATTANLVVKASKGGVECASGTTVQVSLTDLQEMQNHMRENIDAGLKELQAKQGQGGLPKAPGSAQAPPTQPEFVAIAPPAPPSDAADIQAQTTAADQAETEAQGNGAPVSSIPSPSAFPAAVFNAPQEPQTASLAGDHRVGSPALQYASISNDGRSKSWTLADLDLVANPPSYSQDQGSQEDRNVAAR